MANEKFSRDFIEITKRILTRALVIFQPRRFAVRLWNGEVLPADGEPRFTLVLNHPGALRNMFLPPTELSVGEAFLRGDFDLEGDFFAAFELEALFRKMGWRQSLVLARDLLLLPRGQAAPLTRNAAALRGKLHSRERDRAAISYHYDVGNDFYALWLDRRMVYSCAYFPTGAEDLETAQEKKLDYICRKLHLREGERLLDIGCGWGALALHAAEKYGVEVLGVTLSTNQAKLANERIAERDLETRARVELRDYRDLDPSEPFDKIVSIAMFEAIGRSSLPEYFAQTSRLLKPGGLFLNHGIALAQASYQPSKNASFVDRYVFPDGELESVNEVNWIGERAGFEVRDVENLREHYARTLRYWVARLEAKREEAIRIAGETTYRVWRLYMAGSAYHFERGEFNIYQTLFAKPNADGSVQLPWSRAELYRA